MDVDFSTLATTEYANILDREHFIDFSIHPLWHEMPRISGPAYTVQGISGDNLALHAAIYKAPVGSIIVMDAVDCKNAVAGGNVCAIAQKRGIKGFIIDGVIRDVTDIEEIKFPVYAKGVFPVPGKKKYFSKLATPIVCGGVTINTGDIIVADIEGIAVIPQLDAMNIYQSAKAKFDKEIDMSLAEWEIVHRDKVEKALVTAINV